jgi:hypothetical protein
VLAEPPESVDVYNSLTSFECILRTSVRGVEDCLEADESPAAGEKRWFGEAAAARGTEKSDRMRDEDARRKAEANTLAVDANSREVVVVVVVVGAVAGRRE